MAQRRLAKVFRPVSIACLGLFSIAAHAETIISVEGPSVGEPLGIGFNLQVLAVGWSQSTAFSAVNITADVAGFYPQVTVDAWLTTRIGPGTTALDQIAETSVLVSTDMQPVNLFSDLALGPGTYYLVLSASTVGVWGGTEKASDAVVTSAPGVTRDDRLLAANFYNGLPDYLFPPDSTFQDFPTSFYGYNLVYDVTSAPEPSLFFLTCASLIGAVMRTRFKTGLLGLLRFLRDAGTECKRILPL